MRLSACRLISILALFLSACTPPAVAPPTSLPSPVAPLRTPAPPLPTTEPLAPAVDAALFFEDAYLAQLQLDPERLSDLKLGDEESEQRLNDPSPAVEEELYQLLREQREALLDLSIPRDAGVELSYDLFLWRLEDEINGYAYRYHRYPVNPIFGPHNDLIETLRDRHPIEDVEDAQNYLQRLSFFETKIDGQIRWLQAQKKAGIATPSFAVDQSRAQIRRFLAQSPERSPIFSDFEEKISLIQIDSDRRAQLLEESLLILRDQVYPAYRRLGDALADLPLSGDDHPGLVYQPNGEAAYAYRLSHHTTTSLSADEIHQLGLDEVARIQAEMNTHLDELGIDEGALARRMGLVAQRSGSLTGASRIVDEYRRQIEEAEERVAPLFVRVPSTPLEITPVDSPGAPGGYYVGPAADGSRAGTFYVNLAGKRVFLYAVPTLAYHEGVPGHHFQIALQQELNHLPSFRRFTFNTAYVEGWALYAERLAWEAGLYEDNPLGNLGRLQGELFRAARLVVDTGIHHLGWSRSEANDYMDRTVGYPPGALRSEVDRYILWPGQATAYKVGMEVILTLRNEVEAESGDGFELAEFHRVVLEEGSMPLEILRREVERQDWP